MEIIRGKVPSAKKVVVYGPEGIGKSTFASCFPNALFIDTEGSTKEMDIARTKTPSSWNMLLDQINQIKSSQGLCQTLVIDTIDWAEQMCVTYICDKHNKSGIEDFGYGNGYVYAKEEFGRFLNRLEEVVQKGIHVVLSAHAQLRKFEQPDEMGAYDRWELKLGKKTTSQTSPLVKEWADMVLFANYKTFSVAVDDKGKKRKAQGGSRVMYTVHHPCWDAKNRYGLPEEMPFEYSGIAHIIEKSVQAVYQDDQTHSPVKNQNIKGNSQEEAAPDNNQTLREKECSGDAEKKAPYDPMWESNPNNIPQALKDLMRENEVTEWDIQNAVMSKGYFTSDVPIERYNQVKPGFVEGVLIAAWPKVLTCIKEIWEKQQIPYN